ncbi:MAG: CoA pyrophosphatase [Chitinophagales bacterium]
MQQLIDFLRQRLKGELPHQNIHNENLPAKLVEFILAEEKATKERLSKKPPRICAVMMAFYEHEGDVYLPMMLRPNNSRTHPSQIAFPGGKAEKEDADLIATAIREMEEEVGVRVHRDNIIGKLSPVYIPPSNALVTPIVGFLDHKPQYIPDHSEVAEVLDVHFNDLLNPDNIRIKKVPLINGDFLDMPAYAANDTLIWGGTARMISEMVKLMRTFDHPTLQFG